MLGSLVDGGRLSGRGKASPAQGSATEHLSLKTRQKPTLDVLDVTESHVVSCLWVGVTGHEYKQLDGVCASCLGSDGPPVCKELVSEPVSPSITEVVIT